MSLPVIFIDYRTGEITEPVPSKADGWYPVDGKGFTSNPRMALTRPVALVAS